MDRGGRKPRFDAYGTPCDPCLDPLFHEIELLRGELTELENQVQARNPDRVAP